MVKIHEENEDTHNVFDTFFYAFGALCGQGIFFDMIIKVSILSTPKWIAHIDSAICRS